MIITFYHLNKATSPKSRFLALINNHHISSKFTGNPSLILLSDYYRRYYKTQINEYM